MLFGRQSGCVLYLIPAVFTVARLVERNITVVMPPQLADSDSCRDRHRPSCETASSLKRVQRCQNLDESDLGYVFNLNLPTVSMGQRSGKPTEQIDTEFLNREIAIFRTFPKPIRPVDIVQRDQFLSVSCGGAKGNALEYACFGNRLIFPATRLRRTGMRILTCPKSKSQTICRWFLSKSSKVLLGDE